MLGNFKKKSIASVIATGVAAMGLATAAPVAMAQDEVEGGRGGMAIEDGAMLAEDMQIGFSAGIDYNTHFISYGLDVWAQGAEWGGRDTLNPWAELAIGIGDFTIVTGLWADINDNAPPSLGGDIQEIDWWIGVSYSLDEFSFGVTYQAWAYAGGTEKILDLSFSYDDSALWGESGFALSPGIVLHKRLSSSNIGTVPGGDENGWVVVFGIEPGFTLIDSESYPVDISIPVSIGLFTEDGFHGLDTSGAVADTGFGFISVGLFASMPLTFVPAEYGSWSVSAGITYYHTNEDVIANPDEDFVTGTIGFALDF